MVLWTIFLYAWRLGRMTQPTPTVTIHSTASQMPVVLARLTTGLLHAHYAFLQTCHSTGHVDIDVFDQRQQHLVHCTIRETEADTLVPALSVWPAQETMAPDLVPLIHELVQACTATLEHRLELGGGSVAGTVSESDGEDDHQR